MKNVPARHHAARTHHPAAKRRGMVLVIVMIIIVLVSLAGFSFAAVMLTERKAVQLHGDEMQAQAAVDSGRQLMTALLAEPREAGAEIEATGGLYDNPDLFRNVPVADDETTPRQVRFTMIAPKLNDDDDTFAGYRYGLVDESSRLNLTVLLDWDRAAPGAAKRALLALPNMTESLADALLDWIDADTEPRILGAEEDYYAALEPPVLPANGIPSSLEELLQVKGMTHSLLLGSDRNRNHRIDGDETVEELRGTTISGSYHASSPAVPLESYLTLYSAERNVTPSGKPRINLNEDNLQKLAQSLKGIIPDAWIHFIIAYRQHGAYSDSEAGADAAGLPLDLSAPAKFRIESPLDLIGVRVNIAGTSASSSAPATNVSPAATGSTTPATIYESPFKEDRLAMEKYLPLLLDFATVDPTPIIRGRVNVNRAPLAVLSAVPGLDPGAAAQIISRRAQQTEGELPGRRHATWLLVEGLVNLETMKQLLPYLNGGGDVYRAQIVGFFAETAPTARAEVVIDAAADPPRQVYYRDLRMLGRGYSPETLGVEVGTLNDPGATN